MSDPVIADNKPATVDLDASARNERDGRTLRR
jgi:hypothetical protein